ncbi:MAG: hypothetical protein H8E87_00185 [FCB group bacterium]|nr:hypothetical protein [FCB group bacterium]
MPENEEIRKCACGCGKILNGMLSPKRLYWYGHKKIGKDRFWFYLNHPPKCLCGCGEETDWDPINNMWKNFKGNHGKGLSPQDIAYLRKLARRDSNKQMNLFSMAELMEEYKDG